ncbi:MAG: twin-arginine translocation pathway signal protein [Burkholderiales bacterium]|nr:twin-arginine translocation pathway signal protein [Burkholderiales bacterium]
MKRRNFIALAGGGFVAAAGAAALGTGALSAGMPAETLVAWQGPGAEADPRRRAVAYAITAPNPHNLQPWMVDLREANAITLYCDRARLLPDTDPFGRQILVGHGAFIELLVMALAQQGLRSEVALWPQGRLPAQLKDWDQRPVARLVLSPGGVADPLFAQVLHRHTPKVDFDISKPVAPAVLQQALAQASAGPIKVAGTVDEQRLPALRSLCWEAAKVELLTPATVMESLRLTRVGPEEIAAHRDGISINGAFPRAANVLGLLDRTAPPREGSPAYDQMMSRFGGHSRTAMGFIWLATPGNTRAHQLEAGRAYVRLQLKATELGLGLHPMSQALQEFPEMAAHYASVHQLLIGKPAPRSEADETVQMFCRIGYPAAEVLPSPRREVSALLRA